MGLGTTQVFLQITLFATGIACVLLSARSNTSIQILAAFDLWALPKEVVGQYAHVAGYLGFNLPFAVAIPVNHVGYIKLG